MKKMKSLKGEHNYRFEDDILFIRPLSRDYSSSVQLENFILDLDAEGKIVGIELFNASKLFNIPKAFLKNILKGNVQIVVDNNILRIEIKLESEVRNGHKLTNLAVEKVKPSYLDESELSLAMA